MSHENFFAHCVEIEYYLDQGYEVHDLIDRGVVPQRSFQALFDAYDSGFLSDNKHYQSRIMGSASNSADINDKSLQNKN